MRKHYVFMNGPKRLFPKEFNLKFCLLFRAARTST